MTPLPGSGTLFLAKRLLRQAIWELFNRHRPGSDKTIALVGSRRSGSTLLMQMIAQNKGIKFINQPFSFDNATEHQLKFLPRPAGGLFLSPTESETAAIVKYLEMIGTGRLHVQEPWRLWRSEFKFRSDRLVLKTTDAHFLVPIFRGLGMKIVPYFRHPIPQSLSCHRNRWDDKIEFYRKYSHFPEHFLDEAQCGLFDRISKEGSVIERFVLGWCLENQPLFREMKDRADPVVFYERLLLEPDRVISMLSDHCDLPSREMMKRSLARQSYSVRGLSHSRTADAIARQETSALLSGWRSDIDSGQLNRLQKILDAFPGCPYHVDSDQEIPR